MLKIELTAELYNYLLQFSIKEHDILKQIRCFNQTLPNGDIQIPPEQAQFMTLLAKIIGAKKYLEIGVFTGYSSLAMALAMGSQSQIYAIDHSQKYLNIANSFWQLAGVDKQIIPILGEASDALDKLCSDQHLGSFDIAFIDANKSKYKEHYEYCYKLVRHSGIILIDNVLMRGKILNESSPKYVKAIREFNEFIYNDIRVDIVILPIADGLTIAYKKQ